MNSSRKVVPGHRPAFSLIPEDARKIFKQSSSLTENIEVNGDRQIITEKCEEISIPGTVPSKAQTGRQLRRKKAQENKAHVDKENLSDFRYSYSVSSSLQNSPQVLECSVSSKKPSSSKRVSFSATVIFWEEKKTEDKDENSDEPDILSNICASISFALITFQTIYPKIHSNFLSELVKILESEENDSPIKLTAALELAKNKPMPKVGKNAFGPRFFCCSYEVSKAENIFEKLYQVIAAIKVDDLNEDSDSNLNEDIFNIIPEASLKYMKYLTLVANSHF